MPSSPGPLELSEPLAENELSEDDPETLPDEEEEPSWDDEALADEDELSCGTMTHHSCRDGVALARTYFEKKCPPPPPARQKRAGELNLLAAPPRFGRNANGMDRVFVCGFPGLYGGASTELHHQIAVWLALGMEVHLIPNSHGYEQEPLYPEMLSSGVVVHRCNEWEALRPGDPVLGFCSADFLANLGEIRRRTRRTVFLNCMTWLFDAEKQRAANGEIAMFLYQNEDVRTKQMPELRSLNPDPGIRFMTFKPYFDAGRFPFVADRASEFFGCGRISRQDTDKYSRNTLHIYEYFVSPKLKRGLFLGFDHRAEGKIGKPYDWIRTARDQRELSQQEFYRHCEIVLQPTDTTENWPRVGFEAMASGSVLIVDNRGGWRQMVEHGKTGWLCDHERDFIYYASKMAYEPERRAEMAEAARLRGLELGGMEESLLSWTRVFEELAELPE